MKKLATLAIVFIMAVTLVACGEKKEEPAKEQSAASNQAEMTLEETNDTEAEAAEESSGNDILPSGVKLPKNIKIVVCGTDEVPEGMQDLNLTHKRGGSNSQFYPADAGIEFAENDIFRMYYTLSKVPDTLFVTDIDCSQPTSDFPFYFVGSNMITYTYVQHVEYLGDNPQIKEEGWSTHYSRNSQLHKGDSWTIAIGTEGIANRDHVLKGNYSWENADTPWDGSLHD